MESGSGVVVLFDIDNTLIDNDRIEVDLRLHIQKEYGFDASNRYFAILEELRKERGYADYLGALQCYRNENFGDLHLLQMSFFLIDYPFADRLYPGSLDVLKHARLWGRTVILSDGDVVFQPRKAQRSGLMDAVDGHLLIYIHKETMPSDVQKLYPAHHYIMIDDKLRILEAMKNIWKGQLTTVWVRQGHYAFDHDTINKCQAPDLTIERIGDLINFDLLAFLPHN